MPVGQVPAMGEVHGQDPVAGSEDAEIDRHVRLAPAVRLDVHMVGTKKFFRPLDRECLHDIHKFAASIPTAAGIALRVFVCQAGPLRFHHRTAGEILGGDEFDVFELAPMFMGNGFGDLWIRRGEGGEFGGWCRHGCCVDLL